MPEPRSGNLRQILLAIVALIILLATVGAVMYGLSKVLTGTVGGAFAGGLVSLAVALLSKAFDQQNQREAAIAEKKREVYRRLLTPWEKLLVKINAGEKSDDLLKGIDLEAMYAGAFDAVLYGSETVVQRFVEFRSPTSSHRDAIDTMRSLAALLVAMREDVTGKKTALSVESVLGTVVNFTDDERLLIRLREYVAANPEAQKKVAELLVPEKKADPRS
jgi:hypothetical protein